MLRAAQNFVKISAVIKDIRRLSEWWYAHEDISFSRSMTPALWWCEMTFHVMGLRPDWWARNG